MCRAVFLGRDLIVRIPVLVITKSNDVTKQSATRDQRCWMWLRWFLATLFKPVFHKNVAWARIGGAERARRQAKRARYEVDIATVA